MVDGTLVGCLGANVQSSAGDRRRVGREGDHGHGIAQHDRDSADGDGRTAGDHGAAAAHCARRGRTHLHQQCYG